MRRGSSWLFSVGLFSSVLVALGVGCSETGTTTPDGGAEADSGQPVTEAGAPDTSAPDAGGPDAGCTGACRTLALGATYGASRPPSSAPSSAVTKPVPTSPA
jgi:hypothetical protein